MVKVKKERVLANKKYREKNREKIRTKNKEWYSKNREWCQDYCRNRRFVRAYGITFKNVNEMAEKQNNLCAICGQQMKGKKSRHVDHDHKTGKVRELLCSKCNLGLGHFNDDTSTLQSAIHYLNKWEELTRVCQS